MDSMAFYIFLISCHNSRIFVNSIRLIFQFALCHTSIDDFIHKQPFCVIHHPFLLPTSLLLGDV